jgi:hypothetical protein
MKLILFLIAIYSLIINQSIKDKKAEAFSEKKKIIKEEPLSDGGFSSNGNLIIYAKDKGSAILNTRETRYVY